jgi:(2R)-ethylmalonyl-CoA mutase
MNRLRAIESGDLKIIGVNCFQETAESPLTLGSDGAIMKTDPAGRARADRALQAHRRSATMPTFGPPCRV